MSLTFPFIRCACIARDLQRVLDLLNLVLEPAASTECHRWLLQQRETSPRVVAAEDRRRGVSHLHRQLPADYRRLRTGHGPYLATGRTLPDEIYFVGVVFLWLSPSVNWVVYGVMNAKFARAYRYLLCGGKKTPAAASRKQRRSLTAIPVVGKAARHLDSLDRRGRDSLMREEVQRSLQGYGHACTL